MVKYRRRKLDLISFSDGHFLRYGRTYLGNILYRNLYTVYFENTVLLLLIQETISAVAGADQRQS